MPIQKIYKLYFADDRKYVRSLKNILGFVPSNLSLYKLAFRHKSAAEEIKTGIKNSNERLEFLGDAVLGAVVAEVLFKKFPFKDEGFLTELRSKMVNRIFLNQLARKIGLSELITLDTRSMNLAARNGSLLGDAFEALIGAVYLDKGFDFTRSFIIKHILKPHVDINQLEITETNFKSKLLIWCQREGKTLKFDLIETAENGNKKLFTISANIDGVEFGTGKDFNKKNAEKIASENTCLQLKI